MKPLENVWSGLLQRRLLPVAILLLAALAAIPFVLAKDPEPAPQAPAPAADKALEDDAATADPVVSLVADGERSPAPPRAGRPQEPVRARPGPEGRGRRRRLRRAGGAADDRRNRRRRARRRLGPSATGRPADRPGRRARRARVAPAEPKPSTSCTR